MKEETKYLEFLQIAKNLNQMLNVTPLLYGSLGLGKRLGINLNADDIDILVPEIFLSDRWSELCDVMTHMGYGLYDIHEHAFSKEISVAFASIENLKSFANIEITSISKLEDNGVNYLLLDLCDYRKVYSLSLKDSYRQNKKQGADLRKIRLIDRYSKKGEVYTF